jgi:hypothetical protein
MLSRLVFVVGLVLQLGDGAPLLAILGYEADTENCRKLIASAGKGQVATVCLATGTSAHVFQLPNILHYVTLVAFSKMLRAVIAQSV